jgi:hypothetical protein
MMWSMNGSPIDVHLANTMDLGRKSIATKCDQKGDRRLTMYNKLQLIDSD